MNDTWSVLKTTFDPVNSVVATPILSRTCDMPPAEASVRIRNSRGVLLRGIERAAAERAAGELCSAGIPAAAAPDPVTLPPGPPFVVRTASATAEGLRPERQIPNTTLDLPWNQVLAVTAGRVKEVEQTRTPPAANRWRMSATASERLGLTSGHKPVEAGRLSDRLSVVGGSPLQHYRIDGDRFNYGSLFPRPSPIGEANFCMLVNGILRLSTGAFTNIQPVQVSADGGLALEIFEDTHEFDRTVSWLTAIARLRLWMTGAPIPAPERTTIVRPEQNQP